jgi:acetyl esterase/lipase
LPHKIPYFRVFSGYLHKANPSMHSHNYLMQILKYLAAIFICAVNLSQALAQSANQVGFWYKPTEPGWGLSIQQQGSSTQAVWFTFDAQRKPIWHSLQCSFIGNSCAGALVTANGTPLAQITDATTFKIQQSGTATLTLTATNRLNLSYAIGNIVQTKFDLEPQDFAAPADIPLCSLQTASRANATNYTDHWWGAGQQAGWGVQISHQANTVFFGWYSYNDAGSATWLVGIGRADAASPSRFKGDLYQVPTGVAFFDIFTPTQPQTNVVGSFSLNFSNGETGAFSYSLPSYGIVNRALNIERFAIAGGATNLCSKRPQTLNLPAGDITPNGVAPACVSDAPITLSYVANGAPAQKLDLYLPNSTNTNAYPTVVWIHGGGWIMGDKADVAAVKRLVCKGYAVASINYRLSGTAKFPAQIYDVKAAIRFLRANAANYKLDPNKFASFGSSASGHLASLAATSGGVADLEDLSLGNVSTSSHVHAGVAWYGPSDFAQMDAQTINQGCSAAAATHGRSDSPESNLLGCTIANAPCAANIRRANPVNYISRNTPPLLLMHGTQDCTVPNAQSTVVQTAMQAANRCSTKRNVIAASHGGAAWESNAVQDAVTEFLSTVFAAPVGFDCKLAK